MEDIKKKLVSLGNIDEIVELLGPNMSTKNWLALLEKYIRDANPGDIVFHAHSHHGAQVSDSTETDGLAEVWCPDDFDWDPDHMIVDDQMDKLLSLLKPGAQFVDWADCCHAADSLRELMFKDEKAKFIPNFDLSSAIMRITSTPIDPDRRPGVTQLAACRSNQTSADACIGGHCCGAFTHYALEIWGELGSPAYGPLIDATVPRLSRYGYSQRPEFVGTADFANRIILT